MNQRNTPQQKSVNMLIEMSLVDLVLITLISCGKSETVVIKAASKPRIVIISIGFRCDQLMIFLVFCQTCLCMDYNF
jgi:hypothetical protein